MGLGEGQGTGPRPEDESTLTNFQSELIHGQMQQGKILAAIRVKGDQVRGESEVEVVEAYREIRQSEEQAISRERIPAGMKKRVGKYFDAIDPHSPESAPVVGKAGEDAEPEP
jgi:hypothetical protein